MPGAQKPPFLPAWALPLAALAEPVYRCAMGMRNALFDLGIRRIRRAHAPVISVGNLTTGGTGKTPMVIEIVHRLQALGRRPAIILRGYRRTAAGVSDEQAIYAKSLPGVVVMADPDRVAAAARLAADHPERDIIVLDDAFQHRRIARDLDLVLIDGTNPWGYGHVLPRGSMRESPRGLRRADAVIVTRADQLDPAALARLDEQIARRHGKPPIAHAAHVWADVVDEDDRRVDAAGQPVFAFCGIGNPRAFFDQAAAQMKLAGSIALPDHVDYDRQIVQRLAALPEAQSAAAYLTTEKDWVKLQPLVKSSPLPRPVWRVRLAMKLLDGEAALNEQLAAALQAHRK